MAWHVFIGPCVARGYRVGNEGLCVRGTDRGKRPIRVDVSPGVGEWAHDGTFAPFILVLDVYVVNVLYASIGQF